MFINNIISCELKKLTRGYIYYNKIPEVTKVRGPIEAIGVELDQPRIGNKV